MGDGDEGAGMAGAAPRGVAVVVRSKEEEAEPDRRRRSRSIGGVTSVPAERAPSAARTVSASARNVMGLFLEREVGALSR